ncbi:unnamed protein product, partial [Iphiclides podalirius]
MERVNEQILSESSSITSESFHCEHGSEEKPYSEEKIMKIFMAKEIDPITIGYLLMRLEDDFNFDLVSQALDWHLSSPNSKRPSGTVKLNHTLAAATDLCETAVRMLSLSTVHRFATFLEIALLLAYDNVDNCNSL